MLTPSFTYDPSLPVRDPRTKGHCPHEDLVLDMASIICICVGASGTGTCYERELIAAGFSPAEIGRAGDEARAAAAAQLKPESIDEDLVDAMAAKLARLPRLDLRDSQIVAALVEAGFSKADVDRNLDRAAQRARELRAAKVAA